MCIFQNDFLMNPEVGEEERTVQLLCDAGADTELLDCNDHTALHFAEKKKRAVSAKILREAERKRPRRIFFVLFAMFWRLLRTCVETPMSLFL